MVCHPVLVFCAAIPLCILLLYTHALLGFSLWQGFIYFYDVCIHIFSYASACMLTNCRKHDHITPVFHWLPVKFTIDFKLLFLVLSTVLHLFIYMKF